MRVVVDVTPLFNPLTGIGHYFVGTLGGLVQAAGDEHEVVAFAPAGPRARRGRGRPRRPPVERRSSLVPPSAHAWRTAWSRTGLPPVERLAGPLDVFHFSDWM